jgi:hypothetical protein
MIINSFISLIEGFLNDALKTVSDLVEIIPEQLRGPLGDLVGMSITLPRVSFQLPDVSLTGAQKGGMFSGGALRVGERGEEIITSADKMAVFPNNFVTAIQSLESVIASSMFIPSGNNISNSNTTNSNTTNQTINFNQPVNPVTARQQLSLVT